MFRKGDTVKIISTQRTKPEYSINSTMINLVGKTRKVESVERDGKVIRIEGFMWRPEDLILVDTKNIDPNKFRKYDKINFQFDPTNLDV